MFIQAWYKNAAEAYRNWRALQDAPSHRCYSALSILEKKIDFSLCHEDDDPVDKVLWDVSIVKKMLDMLRNNMVKASVDIEK